MQYFIKCYPPPLPNYITYSGPRDVQLKKKLTHFGISLLTKYLKPLHYNEFTVQIIDYKFEKYLHLSVQI